MVSIKSTNEIVLSLIDFFKVTSPDLDTKPGTVARDLFIDAPASQISLLYDELGKISNLQSLRLVAASDLDRLAQNFGATRKIAKKSSGTALFTFNSIPAVISINSGALITASSGATFSVVNGVSVNPSQSNFYKSIAVKFQNDLSFLNITDQYAVEVSVQATTPGISGNISKYSLNRANVSGVSNVTNVFPFTGGSNQEDDATFRNRVLAIFSGSNIGTALGYKNLALSDSSVQDAIVVSPGDPLMTRDGSQVQENADGSFTVISEGTGGKIDIVILGSRISEFKDTFIYRDQSNNNDPTDEKNIVVLGQITGDENKTVTKKRIDNIAAGIVPAQPVKELLEVTGTLSGTNFIPKSIDSFGRITGNYELIKDTGVYGGSPWGFDKFHWVSNQISLFQEDRIKSKFNGQDNTTFTDVLRIPKIQQNISIANENSLVSNSDRSIIQLIHTPASNITRVFNVNTGERYTVKNQNLDGTGSTNTTGRIQITGNTLPSSSDILQVDYIWIVDYDCFSDYDGKILNNNPRLVTDSIDWGIANAVRNERILFTANPTNTFFTGTSKHPVSSVISANLFSSTVSTVTVSTVANFSDRLAINLTEIVDPVDSIEQIKFINSSGEVYITADNDGFIINTPVVVGIELRYNTIIVLPTDTSAKLNDIVVVTYNQIDTFNASNSTGSFTSNQITIPTANIGITELSTYLDVTYIATIQDLLSAGITNFPISRSGNGYVLNDNSGSLNSTKSNGIKRENQTIQLNVSNQKYVTLSITSNDYLLNASQIISVIDLINNNEIWNSDFPGTVTNDINGNYQLVFSGLNNPEVGNNVLVLYFADDLVRTQPFTYYNSIVKLDFQTLLFDFAKDNFYVPIHSFTVESGISFDIIDNTTGLPIASSTGSISSISLNADVAIFTTSFDFSSLNDLIGKSIKLKNTTDVNNKGIFNILSIVNNTTLTIGISAGNILKSQISVIRLADNKELWSSSSSVSIDAVNNILNIPKNVLAAQGDEVIVIIYTNKNICQAPTKLAITVSDQISNSGIITIAGTTISKVADIVFTAINDGLQQNALAAFKTFLNLASSSTISSNNYMVRLVKLEKVSTTTNNEVLSVLATYDVEGTKVKDNLLYLNEMLSDYSLQNTEFLLPSSVNNINNSPVIGDKLRITFYYATDNDSENIYFTRNGTLYTNKKFTFIEKLYISSGFNSSQSTRFTISSFTQPVTGSRYKAFYDYLAPKQNERILIRYNYNKLISDTTFNVESSRPLNADVLVRSAKELFVDVTMNIVVKQDFITSANIVLQNVKDKLTATVNTNVLGDVLNSSDLIAAAQSVDGVDRARILYFNKNGLLGQVLTLVCQEDQYFVANNILVNQENR